MYEKLEKLKHDLYVGEQEIKAQELQNENIEKFIRKACPYARWLFCCLTIAQNCDKIVFKK